MRLLLVLSAMMGTVAESAAKVTTVDRVTIEYTNNSHPFLPDYVFSCKKVGIAKLQAQAKAYGITVDMSTLRITNVSSSLLAAYIHWTVDVTNIGTRTDLYPPGKELILNKITQKPLNGNCF